MDCPERADPQEYSHICAGWSTCRLVVKENGLLVAAGFRVAIEVFQLMNLRGLCEFDDMFIT